jgi:hypothetical protein
MQAMMNPDEINAPLDYHYSRTIGAKTDKGRCEVKEKRYVPGHGGGWFFTVQDTKTLKVLKLRPKHFTGRVKVS